MEILNKIFNEDCRQTMARMPDNYIDSIVTDPPYELNFMNRHWDSSGIAYNVDLWKECLRILKPGAYLLAFGGTRTSHRMVCAIEDAGFEIRDSIQWIYGSGFPKSMNIGKQIDIKGLGTALKPAYEPICVARKPLAEKTVAQNVLKYGTGAINIDDCRIKSIDGVPKFTHRQEKSVNCYGDGKNGSNRTGEIDTQTGRFPSNVILDEEAAKILDKQAPNAGAAAPVKRGQSGKSKGIYGDFAQKGDDGDSFYGDSGSASRFFYIPKADQDERNAGLYQFQKIRHSDRNITDGVGGANPRNRSNTPKYNFHPTVKPVKLMQYLQRLVTPKGGITYDPFGGSGTSAISASNEGFKWILSELEFDHFDIAIKRIYNNNGLFL